MIFVAVLVIFVASSGPVFGQSSCPNGWVPFNGKCYFISRTKANYHQSMTDCYAKGGRLTTVKSTEENNFLTSYVRVRGGPIYLDGTDVRHEGKWVSSYDNQKLTFTYWKSGEPGGKRGENCLVINSDLKWHDASCSNQYYYACKKEMQKQCLGVQDLLDELIKCKQRCK